MCIRDRFLSDQEREQLYQQEQQRQLRPSAADLDIAISGIGEEGSAAFDSSASELSIKLTDLASQDLQTRASFEQAGVMRDGVVPDEMSRTLLFTLASKANEAQKRSEENTVELMRKLDEGEITESQFDDALYDESNEAFISCLLYTSPSPRD